MTDKIVLVTGAASGIGYETARQFIEQGDIVVGVDLDSEKLERTAKELGDRFVGQLCDITDIDQIEAVAESVREKFGRLDSLINNAGLGRFVSVEDMEEADYLYHFEVLVKAPMFLVKHCIPLLRQSASPNITNVSSSVAKNEISNHHLYSSAKAALLKFTRHLVRDYPGIRSNTVLPGLIATPIFQATGLNEQEIKDTFKAIGEVVPCGRMGQPEDIAGCILFLSSDQASYINGAEIVVDGGWLHSADWRV